MSFWLPCTNNSLNIKNKNFANQKCSLKNNPQKTVGVTCGVSSSSSRRFLILLGVVKLKIKKKRKLEKMLFKRHCYSERARIKETE